MGTGELSKCRRGSKALCRSQVLGAGIWAAICISAEAMVALYEERKGCCDADSVGLLGALLSGPYYVRTVLAARTCKLARTAEGTPVQVHPAGMNRSR